MGTRSKVLKIALIGLLFIVLIGWCTHHIQRWFKYGILNLYAFVPFFMLGALVMAGLVRSCFFLSRQTRINLYVLISSFLFTLLSVELALRFIVGTHLTWAEATGRPFYLTPYRPYPDTFLRKPPNSTHTFSNSEFTQTFDANSMGIRNREISLQKAADEVRILCLGDSFTEGIGSPADSTWVVDLERQLNSENGEGRITLINGGIGGQDPIGAYFLLTRSLIQYEPDIVITVVNWTDLQDIIIRGGFDRFDTDRNWYGNKTKKIEFGFALSYVVRHVLSAMKYDDLLLLPEERKRAENDAHTMIYNCLLEYDMLATEKNFRLLVVFNPLSYGVLNKKTDFSDIQNKLSVESEIPFIDLTWYFANEARIDSSNVSNYFWPIDGHYKPAGNQVFAQGIAKKLDELGWLKQAIAHKPLSD